MPLPAQVLTINLDTDFSSPAITAAIQEYNRTKGPGFWSTEVTTKPADLVLANGDWDINIMDMMRLGDFANSCAIISPSLLTYVHETTQVDDHSLTTDTVTRTQAISYGVAKREY